MTDLLRLSKLYVTRQYDEDGTLITKNQKISRLRWRFMDQSHPTPAP